MRTLIVALVLVCSCGDEGRPDKLPTPDLVEKSAWDGCLYNRVVACGATINERLEAEWTPEQIECDREHAWQWWEAGRTFEWLCNKLKCDVNDGVPCPGAIP